MKVSYRHANPAAGNESFLLRFEEDDGNGHDALASQTPCVLVDAGADVDVEALLGEDDYLAAIVLTHAHSDHYQSLATNLRHGAPIYTSEATASILETVLTDAQRHADDGLGDIEAVLDALEPFEEWVSPVAGLRLAPVPAGHTPGAIGVLIQFEDGSGSGAEERHTVLATGDWTPQHAAGYPGVDTALPVDVEAVFLTASTNDTYETALTDSVGRIYERAHAGSSVVVSASGLTSVQYAYLLGHLGEHLERPLSITLVGQAAKLAVDLDYDVPNVEVTPDFNEPDELLAPGTITIAGPEAPTEGSSGRLFGAIRNDPSATLVQVLAGDDAPITSASCTTDDFAVIAHPTEAAVDTLVEALNPTQVIIAHQRGRAAQRYKEEYNSFVWTTDNTDEYTLYEDSEWIAPPWMTAEGRSFVQQGNGAGRGLWLGDAVDAETTAEIPLPSCARIEESVDLEAEGLDVDTLEGRLRTSGTTETETAASPPADVPTASASESSGADADSGSASDGDAVEAETTASEASRSETEGVGSITDRLDAIEAQLEDIGQRTGATVPARAIDAGDGITLLRVLDSDLGSEIEHGETVRVQVQTTSDSEE